VFFRMNEAGLTGLVSRCASAQARPAEIHDVRLDRGGITFKCTSSDRDRTVIFTGTISGDVIKLGWERQIRAGGLDNGDVDRMFGPSAQRQFTLSRIPDGALAKAADEARGSEFAAAVNLRSRDAKAEALLFLPDKVTQVRAIIVAIDYGNGHAIYGAPEWRKLAETIGGALARVRFTSIGSPTGGLGDVNYAQGGGDALFSVLRRLSEDSGHPELNSAPLVIWGHSGAGGVSSILTGLYPERVLAFVRYHSGPVGGDIKVVSRIPSLLISGGRDTTAPPSLAEKLWISGRALGAPWTFAVHADGVHGELKDLAAARALMTTWVSGVVRQRLPPGASTLRDITDESGWVGQQQSGAISVLMVPGAPRANWSWLPDESTAEAWRELHTNSK
jgi:hypothetical protein